MLIEGEKICIKTMIDIELGKILWSAKVLS